jgi:competence protein ComEC
VLADHPRHLALAGLVAGLLAAGAGPGAPLWCAVAACLIALVARGPGLALLAVALVVAGGWVGHRRLEAIDRSSLRPFTGDLVVVRGFLVKRERPTHGAFRGRVRLSALRLAGGPGHWRRLADTIELRPERPLAAPLAVGDELEARGAIQLPKRRGETSFDYAAYLHRAGVHAVVSADLVRATGRRRGGLPGFVDGIRRRAETGVGAGLDPQLAALARGIVLGQDERIPKQTVERFKASGLAHLLAVSGQNVTLLAILAFVVLGSVGVRRQGRHVGVLLLIALYVPVTGAGPSILRAGAMGAAGTVAALAGRPASRWYALLLAAVFTLVLDPRAWLDPGWQLSFAAVVGIFIGARSLRNALQRLPAAFAEGAAVTLAATASTAPLLAYHFERLSLVSVVANLLALPAVAPIMWLGTLSATVAQVSSVPAALLNSITVFLLAYLDAIAWWSGGLPHAAVPVRIASPAWLAVTYVPVAAAMLLIRGRGGEVRERLPRGVALALAGAGLACLALPLVHALQAKRFGERPAGFRASFLDVGQGDATLLQAPGGVDVLVDGGPPATGIVAKLRGAGVHSLDLVVLTHPQLDHQGGLEEVLRRMPVEALLDGGRSAPDALHRRIVGLAREKGARLLAPLAGEVLHLGRLRLRVLSPRRGDMPSDDPNDRAIVLLSSYRGFDVFLPADAESNVTLGLPLRRVEVLKVAHHASADEGLSELLERLRPRAAVVEVGAHNPYGHPSPPALAALRRAVRSIFRTDRDGEVRISPGASGLLVGTSH